MCLSRYKFSPFIAIGFGLLAGSPLQGQTNGAAKKAEKECAEVLSTMKAAIAREPGRLILCMEDALTTQESCTCTIIREAVSYAGEDHALVGQLVIAAIRMVPSAAARITECAMEVAPGANSAVQAALNKELGKNSGSWLAEPTSPGNKITEPAPEAASQVPPPEGKTPVGKSPSPGPGGGISAQETDSLEIMDFAYPLVGVSGIFMAPPAGRENFQKPNVNRVPATAIITTKSKPFRPVSAVTSSNPD